MSFGHVHCFLNCFYIYINIGRASLPVELYTARSLLVCPRQGMPRIYTRVIIGRLLVRCVDPARSGWREMMVKNGNIFMISCSTITRAAPHSVNRGCVRCGGDGDTHVESICMMVRAWRNTYTPYLLRDLKLGGNRFWVANFVVVQAKQLFNRSSLSSLYL